MSTTCSSLPAALNRLRRAVSDALPDRPPATALPDPTGILAQLGLTDPTMRTTHPTSRSVSFPIGSRPNLVRPVPNLPRLDLSQLAGESNLPNLTLPKALIPDLDLSRLTALSGSLGVGVPGTHDDSARWAAADAGGELRRLTYRGVAGSRDYLLYLPTADRVEAVPLIVMLHGGTQTALDFAAGTRMNHLAERHGFLVAYPEQDRRANLRGYWNWFRAEDQVAGSGEPAIIAGIVDDIRSAHDIDSTAIHVAGLSAGGAMAAVLAASYPELFAGVAVHSGIGYRAAADLPSAFAAMQGAGQPIPGPKPVRTIVFHGTDDQLVAPVNADQIVDAALTASPGLVRHRAEHPACATGRAHVVETFRDTDGVAQVESWRVQGGGHCWFGGDPTGSYVDPAGPDASAAIVRFLLGPSSRVS